MSSFDGQNGEDSSFTRHDGCRLMPANVAYFASRAGLLLALMLFSGVGSPLRAAEDAADADLERGIEAFQAGDYGAALSWLEPVAQEGEAQAQFILGFMHQNGKGVPTDAEKGTALIRQSAEQGYAYAQFALGSSYRFGIGVEQDLLDAHHWLLLAEHNGYDPARQIRMVIEAQLKPDQIARSREAAFPPPPAESAETDAP